MYQIDFKKPMHIHFIGIGGISMSGLASILLKQHFKVSGSDAHESELTKQLEAEGAILYYGQRASNLDDTPDLVVYTAAIHPDNPEYAAAVAKQIPMLSRAELLGQMMHNFKTPVAISGTHGKTTTTSMASYIFLEADMDPTISVGGILDAIGGNIRVGGHDTFLTEACEYTNSFLHFFPKISVILNIDADHLDFFKDLEDIKHSFRCFAERVPAETGTVIANYDDANTMDALRGIARKVITFGLNAKADVYAQNIVHRGSVSEFDIYHQGNYFAHVTLHVPGIHNVRNALAATAAAIVLGVSPNAVKYGLAGFEGAGRRFDYKGKFQGADLYDDYAHHPSELRALLDAVDTLNYQRTIVVFQPHTYSRTAKLFNDFVEQLRRPTIVYLAEIYAAREKNTIGISSADLAAQIPGAKFYPTFAEIERELRRIARPGDIILTVGAGDVFRIGEHLLQQSDSEN